MSRFERLYECVCVCGFVCEDIRVGDSIKQLRRHRYVMGLARGERESVRVSECIDDGVDFCRVPAARRSESLRTVFF